MFHPPMITGQMLRNFTAANIGNAASTASEGGTEMSVSRCTAIMLGTGFGLASTYYCIHKVITWICDPESRPDCLRRLRWSNPVADYDEGNPRRRQRYDSPPLFGNFPHVPIVYSTPSTASDSDLTSPIMFEAEVHKEQNSPSSTNSARRPSRVFSVEDVSEMRSDTARLEAHSADGGSSELSEVSPARETRDRVKREKTNLTLPTRQAADDGSANVEEYESFPPETPLPPYQERDGGQVEPSSPAHSSAVSRESFSPDEEEGETVTGAERRYSTLSFLPRQPPLQQTSVFSYDIARPACDLPTMPVRPLQLGERLAAHPYVTQTRIPSPHQSSPPLLAPSPPPPFRPAASTPRKRVTATSSTAQAEQSPEGNKRLSELSIPVSPKTKSSKVPWSIEVTPEEQTWPEILHSPTREQISTTDESSGTTPESAITIGEQPAPAKSSESPPEMSVEQPETLPPPPASAPTDEVCASSNVTQPRDEAVRTSPRAMSESAPTSTVPPESFRYDPESAPQEASTLKSRAAEMEARYFSLVKDERTTLKPLAPGSSSHIVSETVQSSEPSLSALNTRRHLCQGHDTETLRYERIANDLLGDMRYLWSEGESGQERPTAIVDDEDLSTEEEEEYEEEED